MDVQIAMRTVYEWDIETVSADEYEDVIEHDHDDRVANFGGAKLLAALAQKIEGNRFTRLVLVRDRGDELDGLQDRQWAYVKDGVLPDTFDGGAKVPARFKDELARAVRK